jgi:hypothetical protein
MIGPVFSVVMEGPFAIGYCRRFNPRQKSGGRIVGFLKGVELDNVFHIQSGPAKQRVLRKVVENV